MKLRVIELETFFVVGKVLDDEFDWEGFIESPDPLFSEIASSVEFPVFYEVWDQESENVVIGIRVNTITRVPENCVVVNIPSGTYALIHMSQSDFEHDMFAMTNYETSDRIEFRTFNIRNGSLNGMHFYRPVEYKEDVLNIRSIPVLSNEVSTQLREKYIHTFFNVSGDCVSNFFYKRYVKLDKGYLWQFLKRERATGLTISEVNDYLDDKEEVLFFWDSASLVGRDFTRNKVFKLGTKRLLESYTRFTFDLYIFDSILNWTIIFQHEPDTEGYKCFLITSP
ncbi:hypothetical protein [Brevibacillus brevis]|uniref:hypothetical protein n=1 Tax=Brevibacillus brevis TaxID=1393 RepID=UPI000D109D32|nr:hypothetical protein [Brevibacillus brevis]PSJ71155.1 hypothetical protein C7J99_01115 [Brevibacillus brevis]RED28754.1 hypothetical protein DES34_107104 [Brevibacillus brevis]GEC89758.1 hypothetical protein BBR01nite_20890 [Brevibacillus brevis]VEF91651.1 Uncharacterised protein [Brevibacillus brevis]